MSRWKESSYFVFVYIYIHIYKPRPGSQAQANAQLHVTYDSLTGIIFEFSRLLFGWIYIMYMYISLVCESCCISSLLQLFSLDRSWAFIAIAAAAAIRFCDGGLFPIAILRHMMRGLKKETMLEAYRLTTDLLLYVQARTNLCKLLISSTSSALV